MTIVEGESLDQAETMARAMCQADGHDPDQTVRVSGAALASLGGDPASAEVLPRWRLYEPKARELIEVQKTLLRGE
jgi:hypothetical protein